MRKKQLIENDVINRNKALRERFIDNYKLFWKQIANPQIITTNK